jgi:glycosyltransferase involved in cell wall biosynthesis
MPLISVIIPAYNSAHFIGDSIESVISQTLDDWELLIINDGSTDQTKEIVDQYCRDDDRIKLISRENSGVSVSRNLGVSLAKGDLIAFLDADDRWLPNKLAIHFEYMKQWSDVSASFARVEFLTHHGSPTGKVANGQLTGLRPENFLYTNPTVTVSNIVIRRFIFRELNGFDEKINYSEDIEFLFRCACCRGMRIEGIDQRLVQYRTHSTGLSSTLDKMENGWKSFMQKARSLNPSLIDRHYQSAYSSQLQYLAKQTMRLELSEKIGVQLIHRSIKSDWLFFARQPSNLIILMLLYLRYLSSKVKSIFL